MEPVFLRLPLGPAQFHEWRINFHRWMMNDGFILINDGWRWSLIVNDGDDEQWFMSRVMRVTSQIWVQFVILRSKPGPPVITPTKRNTLVQLCRRSPLESRVRILASSFPQRSPVQDQCLRIQQLYSELGLSLVTKMLDHHKDKFKRTRELRYLDRIYKNHCINLSPYTSSH